MIDVKQADIRVLVRSELLTDPIIRIVEISFGLLATIGFSLSLTTDSPNWAFLLLVAYQGKSLRPPRLSIGLDGIRHRGLLVTAYHPFEQIHDADVARVSNHTCRIAIGDRQYQWRKPFGIDEGERLKLREWLRSAIQAAKEGAELSRGFLIDIDLIAGADEPTLMRLSTRIGTSFQIRILAIAYLVLRGSKQLAEVRGTTAHILSRETRQLVRRALSVKSEEDLEELKKCLKQTPVVS